MRPQRNRCLRYVPIRDQPREHNFPSICPWTGSFTSNNSLIIGSVTALPIKAFSLLIRLLAKMKVATDSTNTSAIGSNISKNTSSRDLEVPISQLRNKIKSPMTTSAGMVSFLTQVNIFKEVSSFLSFSSDISDISGKLCVSCVLSGDFFSFILRRPGQRRKRTANHQTSAR